MTADPATGAFDSVFVDPFQGSSLATTTGGPKKPSRGRVPGEVGIWVFILGDMLAFTNFFVVFAVSRHKQVDVFEASRKTLHLAFGALNTLLLLTGSLFVVFGLQALKQEAGRIASKWYRLAFLCGAIFVVDKVIEYTSEVHAGHTPDSNDFYMYYFLFTGIHLFHLLLGLVALVVMDRIALRRVRRKNDERNVEALACYWHLVDFLWVILFPLLYLAR